MKSRKPRSTKYWDARIEHWTHSALDKARREGILPSWDDEIVLEGREFDPRDESTPYWG